MLLATETFRSLGASVFVGWLFTWLADRLDQRFPHYGRLSLMLVGTLVAVPTTLLFLASDGQTFASLIVFGILSGLAGAAAIVLWPIGQAIVPPELRGSSRAIIDTIAGIAGAAVLAVSGLLADRLGVATMLMLLTPLLA